jgi:hypothetical protein
MESPIVKFIWDARAVENMKSGRKNYWIFIWNLKLYPKHVFLIVDTYPIA